MGKKGFTLIELLTVIIILGIISGLSFPVINQLLRKGKDRQFILYQKSILEASKLYIDNFSYDEFGNDSLSCVKLPYSKLRNSKFIKDFNREGVSCDNDDTYVMVRKNYEKYSYSSSIVCKDENNKVVYENKDGLISDNCTFEGDDTPPTIKVSSNAINTWKKGKDIYAEVTISDDSGLAENITFAYYWVRDKNSPYTTYPIVGDVHRFAYLKNKKGEKHLSFFVNTDILKKIDGKYKLVIGVVSGGHIKDIYGNEANTFIDDKTRVYTIKTDILVDNTSPKCEKIDYEPKTNHWINYDKKVTQYCSDPLSGCKKNFYTKTFNIPDNTALEKDTITIKDKVGNKTVCPVDVFIDKIPPKCGKITVKNQSGDLVDSRTWQNGVKSAGYVGYGYVDVEIECLENTGKYCRLKDSYFTNKPGKRYEDDGIYKVSLDIYDAAGNKTTCPQVEFKIDKTPPECGEAENASDQWSNKKKTIIQHCSDNLSGCEKVSTTYENKKSDTVYIYDNAGNKKLCSYDVYVDTIPPYTPTFRRILNFFGTGNISSTTWECDRNDEKSHEKNVCNVHKTPTTDFTSQYHIEDNLSGIKKQHSNLDSDPNLPLDTNNRFEIVSPYHCRERIRVEDKAGNISNSYLEVNYYYD